MWQFTLFIAFCCDIMMFVFHFSLTQLAARARMSADKPGKITVRQIHNFKYLYFYILINSGISYCRLFHAGRQ